MASESVEPMRVGRRDQWLPKAGRYSYRAAIRIEEAHVKMAKFDGIEAIYFSK
jgi:hypothetical protein